MFNKSKSDDSLNIPSMTERPPEPSRALDTPGHDARHDDSVRPALDQSVDPVRRGTL